MTLRARSLTRLGRYEEAGTDFDQVLDLAARTIGKKHPTYVRVLIDHARFLQATGRALEALDTDGNRRLSLQEFGQWFSEDDYEPIRKLFATFDKDLSGQLEAADLQWLGLR